MGRPIHPSTSAAWLDQDEIDFLYDPTPSHVRYSQSRHHSGGRQSGNRFNRTWNEYLESKDKSLNDQIQKSIADGEMRWADMLIDKRQRDRIKRGRRSWPSN